MKEVVLLTIMLIFSQREAKSTKNTYQELLNACQQVYKKVGFKHLKSTPSFLYDMPSPCVLDGEVCLLDCRHRAFDLLHGALNKYCQKSSYNTRQECVCQLVQKVENDPDIELDFKKDILHFLVDTYDYESSNES